MATTITDAWMDGFVDRVKAAGYPDEAVPGLLHLAGIVEARRDNAEAFNQGFKEAQASTKTAGFLTPEPTPQPEVGLPDRPASWAEKIPFLRSYIDRMLRDRLADQGLAAERAGAGEDFMAGQNARFTPGGFFRRAKGDPFQTYNAE